MIRIKQGIDEWAKEEFHIWKEFFFAVWNELYIFLEGFFKKKLDGPKSNPASLSGIKVSKLRENLNVTKICYDCLKRANILWNLNGLISENGKIIKS